MLAGRLPAAALLLAIAACDSGPPPAEPPRPVRVVAVERSEAGETVALTGQVEAQDEVSLSFRVGGRMIERAPRVGDQVAAGEVVARLEREPAANALRAARANYAAAVSLLTRTRGDFERQDQLLRDGWTTRARQSTRRRRCGSARPSPARSASAGRRGSGSPIRR